jgi:hypothetical protein
MSEMRRSGDANASARLLLGAMRHCAPFYTAATKGSPVEGAARPSQGSKRASPTLPATAVSWRAIMTRLEG